MTYTNTQKRKLLTSALFQHSSKTQSFKQVGLERITERIIYFSGNEGLKEHEIQTVFKEELGYNLPSASFTKALSNLLNKGRIEELEEKWIYKLTEESYEEFKLIEANTEKSSAKLTNKLFHTPPDNKENYIEPFWLSMNYIFSNVGEFSAKLIEGKLDQETVLKPILQNCLKEIKSKFKINYDYFFKQLTNFFENTKEPIYNEFRWVLAQNYFITCSLGINPESEPFSKELFQDTTLYLDTNIILSLISPNNRHFNNVSSLIEAANKLQTNYAICQITVDEYEGWVNSEAENIALTIDQIPKNTKSKIGSCIYQDLQYELSKAGEVTKMERIELLNKVVENYLDFKSVLEKLIPDEKLTYIDDSWFDSIEDDASYQETLSNVKSKYLDLRKRKKSINASVHDAKILHWLDKEISESEKPNWFVTSDFSLPLIKINGNDKSSSIILEAILQWLVPLTNNGDNLELFSQTLKQKILPKEFLFDISDFVIFEELHMECGELPSEDVEDCILYIKKNAPNLNPNLPEDREKLATHIAKYFYDPGRKYKKELSQKELENDNLIKQLGDVMSEIDKIKAETEAKNQEIKTTKERHAKEIEAIQETNDGKIKNLENSLDSVSSQLGDLKEEKRQEKIITAYTKWQRRGKYAFAFFLLLLIVIILEFLPSWPWNYPAKMIDKINALESTHNARYRLLIAINTFVITGLLIASFLYAYRRLFNREKVNAKMEELDKKIK